MKRPASVCSAIFLIAIALGHLLRIVLSVPIVAYDIAVPMWPSVAAIIVTAGLAWWLLAERRSPQGP